MAWGTLAFCRSAILSSTATSAQVWIIDHRKKTLRVFETDGRFHRVTDSYASATGLTITLVDIFGT